MDKRWNNLGLDSRATLNISINNNKSGTDDINIKIQDKFEKSRTAERIAQQLVEMFNQPNYFKFYCKVAHTLPENKIWNNAEQARTANKTPSKLFTWLCQKDMNNG